MRPAPALLACLPLLLLAACGTLGPGQLAQPSGSSTAVSPSPSLPSPSPSTLPSSPPSPARTSSSPRPPKPNAGPGGSYKLTGTSNVALTFDDGPYPENTPQILDLLRANGLKATFCVIGRNAHTYPDLIRRIYNEGHTFCNHTWRHDMELRNRDEGAIRDDLSATINAIHEAVPEAKVPYFRAPGGYFDNKVVRIAASMGMTSIHWDVDPRDWDVSKYGRGPSMVDHVVSNVKQNARPGSIILSHDNLKPDTVTAYKTLMPWLKARFTLVALPADGQLGRA